MAALRDDKTRFTLPRTTRVRARGDYDRIFALRRSAADARLIVYAAPNDAGAARMGIAVSRRLGSAVVRSRYKRLLREAFRLSQHELPAGYDFLLVPRSPGPATRDDYIASLKTLAGQAARRCPPPSQAPS